jgi:hypothetical protein
MEIYLLTSVGEVMFLYWFVAGKKIRARKQAVLRVATVADRGGRAILVRSSDPGMVVREDCDREIS